MDFPVLVASYRWDHTIYGLLCLASFIAHGVFKVHLFCSLSLYGTAFRGRVILRCVDMPYCVLSFERHVGFPAFGCCEQCCCEYWCARFCFSTTFSVHLAIYLRVGKSPFCQVRKHFHRFQKLEYEHFLRVTVISLCIYISPIVRSSEEDAGN